MECMIRDFLTFTMYHFSKQLLICLQLQRIQLKIYPKTSHDSHSSSIKLALSQKKKIVRGDSSAGSQGVKDSSKFGEGMSNHEVHSLKYGSEDVQINGVTHSNTYPDMHIVGS